MLLASGVAAAAEERNGPPHACADADSWFLEAATFVTAETGNAVPAVCVRSVGAGLIGELMQHAPTAEGADGSALAAFVPATGEILLSDRLHSSKRLDRSYLVHELVHAQQFASGAAEAAPCIGSLEGQAYAIQARYLRAGGLEREAFLVDLLGLLQSACEYDY